MKLTPGRIVHVVQPTPSFRDSSTICLPAIVTEVMEGDSAWLTVFSRRGAHAQNCRHDASGLTVNTWHWPERDDD